jgi:hypothetical protein
MISSRGVSREVDPHDSISAAVSAAYPGIRFVAGNLGNVVQVNGTHAQHAVRKNERS